MRWLVCDEEITLLQFDTLAEREGLRHAITTRPLNMAPHRGPQREQSVAWRKRVCSIMGLDFDRLTSPAQVHGGLILSVGEDDVGRGRLGRDSAIPYVDGLMTDRPGVGLILLSADCPLVMAYDPRRPAVGAVHASWLGTMHRISEHLIERMAADYGSDPADLHIGIAPSAGPDAYEVGDEVYRIARARLDDAEACFRPHHDRWLLDLWTANKQQLLAAGVREEMIEIAGICTIGDQRFWSHRRDAEKAGRFALLCSLI